MPKARPRPTRMLWFKFRDGGRRLWRVYLVNRVDNEDDPHGVYEGITHYEKRTIEINVHQTPQEVATTLMHELMHASGGTRSVTSVEREGEEMFITRAERSMTRMMRQMGWQMPALPPGVKLQTKRRAA